ncbi:MAG: sugar phosphate nucleotidyltransferase [Porphyromonas sp.]|nr:sugar phosphate nucleotidyltransferase [Porphyromonas sp.]
MTEEKSNEKSHCMSHYYCVILAGGVGRRFWPYSRRKFPKQFIDFLGTGESLLQTTYRRFRAYFDPEQIFVVTNEEYKSIAYQQLPELPVSNILLEARRRNTTCAIAYATGHITARDPEAVLLISPSDHLILKEQQFIHHIEQALERAHETDRIITLGIKPTYPETNYGYIQAIDPEDHNNQLQVGKIYPVKTFTEKPNKHMSKVLVDSGEFYWNSGIFVSKGRVILDELKQHITELYERLFTNQEVWGTPEEAAHVAEVYPYCPNISFDYAVMEQLEEAEMVLCDLGWTDLGSWSAIYALAEKDEERNATLGATQVLLNDSSNNLVMSTDPESLVVLQGVEDLIVVQNKGVLLVCRRGEELKLKQVVPDAQGLADKFVD